HLRQLCRRRGLCLLASCESKQEPAMPGSVLEFSCARVVAAVDYARLPPASPSKSRRCRVQCWHPPAPPLSQPRPLPACLLRVQSRAGLAGFSIVSHLRQLCRRRGLCLLASCESKQEPAMPGSVLAFSCARVVAAVDYARLPPASPSKS